MQVYVVGGLVRPTTLAIVKKENIDCDTITNISSILKSLPCNGADIAFIGTNGIYSNLGFTTHTKYETATKATMLANAKQKFVVTDPSKFNLRQENTFATFNEGIKIITKKKGYKDTLMEYKKQLKSTSTDIIFA